MSAQPGLEFRGRQPNIRGTGPLVHLILRSQGNTPSLSSTIRDGIDDSPIINLCARRRTSYDTNGYAAAAATNSNFDDCERWNSADGGQSPPVHDKLPNALMPFQGDFKGSQWNSQALFARKCLRHYPKADKVRRLVVSHDFTGVSEAHCLQGRSDASTLPAGCTAFGSDGTSRQAGIGLIIKHS